MIDVYRAKVNVSTFGYIFTDEKNLATLSLKYMAEQYGIDYDDAKKICAAHGGLTRESYHGYWFFQNEDNAIAALTMLKLMR